MKRGQAVGQLLRQGLAHPALALCSTVLWGLFEVIALHGARRAKRRLTR